VNPLLLLLLEAGINIAKTHVSNSTGGEILDTTSFIMDAAQAVEKLYQEENGEPMDWSTIKHHQPLPPAGETSGIEAGPSKGGINDEPTTDRPEGDPT